MADRRQTPEVIAQVIAGIKAHASQPENYENGWDIVVETMSDEDIRSRIGEAFTVTGGIRKMRAGVEVVHEHRKDIMATAF
jgi:hypothetical protein